ncbi:hypothetical protein [Fischerella sp. PCC 9605]|nr:hypothetical protein [Fischerella sp. PCC 9605]
MNYEIFSIHNSHQYPIPDPQFPMPNAQLGDRVFLVISILHVVSPR